MAYHTIVNGSVAQVIFHGHRAWLVVYAPEAAIATCMGKVFVSSMHVYLTPDLHDNKRVTITLNGSGPDCRGYLRDRFPDITDEQVEAIVDAINRVLEVQGE